MPRPVKPRWVSFDHTAVFFQPVRSPEFGIELLELTLDELEALRLADLEGLSQEDAAGRMNISRQTFGRVVASARGKVAHALVRGKGIHIQGGSVEFPRRGGPHGGPAHGDQRGGGLHRGGPHGPHGHGHGEGSRRQDGGDFQDGTS